MKLAMPKMTRVAASSNAALLTELKFPNKGGTEMSNSSLIKLTVFSILYCMIQPVFAALPALSVSNLQPVNAPSIAVYAPESVAAITYVEPVAYGEAPWQGYRANIDLQIVNNEPDYIRLDGLTVNIGDLNPQDLTDDQLIKLPNSFLIEDLGSEGLRRSTLADGGFNISGFRLEKNLFDWKTYSHFGKALDVLSYQFNGDSAYIVSGTNQNIIGDPPESPADDLPTVDPQGFLAQYDAAGNLEFKKAIFSDKPTALADLGDGRILVAGQHYDEASVAVGMVISRYQLWETDAKTAVASKLNTFRLDEDFGDDLDHKGVYVEFEYKNQPCNVKRVASVRVANSEDHYVAVAELACSGGRRAGVVVVNTDGQLLEEFGDAGLKVFAGPKGEDVIPVGALPARLVGFTTVGKNDVWLGAAVGEGCVNGGETKCSFGLTRFDLLSGALNKGGWLLVGKIINSGSDDYTNRSTGLRPYDLSLDVDFGRPILAGTGWFSGTRAYTVMRFTTIGTIDNTFGLNGAAANWFASYEGGARAVQALSNGKVAVAIQSVVDIVDNKEVTSMGLLNLDQNGVMEWEHSPWDANTLFMHFDRTELLKYGNISEDHLASAPTALVEDWNQNIAIVGWAASDKLLNPCQQLAEEKNDDQLAFAEECGGPESIAFGRYLPFGEPDSRRWVKNGKKRLINVPEDRNLGVVPPSLMVLELDIDGFEPFVLQRAMNPFYGAMDDNETNSFGSYRFPFAPDVLKDKERFYVKSHTLDHHHRNKGSSRFAYDIKIMRWDSEDDKYTVDVKDPGEDATSNARQLAWGRPVRALADGKVLACHRSAKDNTDDFTGPDANYVKIQHTFDGIDSSKHEIIRYLHFRHEGISTKVCPYICPDSNPCDSKERVDPDGDISALNIEVEAGDLIGLVGNSGTSTNPHLHIEMSTDAGMNGPTPGGYPLLFHSVELESLTVEPGTGPSFTINTGEGRAIYNKTMARPLD